MIGTDDVLIEKNGRHIPPILGKQLVLKLVDQYLDNYHRVLRERHMAELKESFECIPSIERFHGAMLFVDISGFTALSQRLNVDELRIHINGYFKKILDIVFKFSGEVIKFAGDALFIVWQTKSTATEGPEFEEARRAAVTAATACGMEVNQSCSHYKVTFHQQNLNNSLTASAVLNRRDEIPLSPSENLNQKGTPTNAASPAAGSAVPEPKKESFTYLNVHAGVSVGTMAGIDVGANDRWEYLLVGDPLVSVAKAESEAAVAELVLSPEAHGILHTCSEEFAREELPAIVDNIQLCYKKGQPVPMLPCGCQLTKGGFFKVNQTITGGSNLDVDDEPDPEYELAFYAELMSNVTIAYDTMKPVIYDCYNFIAVKQQMRLLQDAGGDGTDSLVGTDGELSEALSDKNKRMSLSSKDVKLHSSTDKDDKLFVHYLHWIQSCIIDDLVRHVHEADRGNFGWKAANRTGCLLSFARDNLKLLLNPVVSPSVGSGGGSAHHSSVSSSLSGHSSVSSHTSSISSSGTGRRENGDSFVSKIRSISNASTTRRRKKEKHERTLQKDATLTAELRSVIVLFIKLDVPGAIDLYFDPLKPSLEALSTKEKANLERIVQNTSHAMSPTSRSPVTELEDEGGVVIDGYNFLKRSDKELEEDTKLLGRFQSCMEIMTKIFLDKGGQMRQFIVDDKGTVCIGTFGLRGSVNNDNAAAAIETAQDIIDQLAEIGIKSGVGITSGKAFCGLVGSTQRHEYAVMGPSINLSARLMAKSEWGEILCSEEARSRDRTHDFDACGTINAKGYDYPVPIFKPLMKWGDGGNLGGGGGGGGLNLLPPTMLRRQTSQETAVSASSGSPRKAVTPGGKLDLAMPSHDEGDNDPNSPLHPLQVPATPLAGESSSHLGTATSASGNQSSHHHHHDDHNHGHEDDHKKPQFHMVGRAEEATAAYRFLLPSIHHQFPDLHYFEKARDKHSAERAAVQDAGLSMNLTDPMRLCVIQAGGGIGKSNFLHTFMWQLKNLHKADKGLNFALFQKKSSSFRSSEPFGGWKSIVEHMLVSAMPPVAVQGKTKHEKVVAGLDLLMSGLSAEMQELRPLLTSIHHVRGIPDNETTKALKGAPRATKTTELLSALIQQYCNVTRNAAVIVMDDIQCLDSASWSLLKQLMATNLGVIVLGSYLPSVSVSSPHNKSNSDNLSFFESLPAQFRRIELDVMDEITTGLFCDHLMSMYGIKGTNNVMYDIMHEISGGNPLYLYEITQSFIQKQKEMGIEPEVCEAGAMTPGCMNAFNALVKDFSTNRIEEVIFFRFDQLDPATQLLLKMASVVCANGSRFTVSMIAFMMSDTDENDTSGGGGVGNSALFKLIQTMGSERARQEQREADQQSQLHRDSLSVIGIIKDLLKKHEFIKTASSGMTSSRGSGSTGPRRRNSSMSGRRPSIGGEMELDDEPIGFDTLELTAAEEFEYYSSLEFEFRVHLEQLSVYALMLNDQKESLHDRVASYLERKGAAEPLGFIISENRPSEVYEEGFHWEHSANWAAAMTCYYRSATMLEAMGAFEENFVHLTAAYRMLNAMRRDVGVMEASIVVPASFQVLFSSSSSGGGGDVTKTTTSTTVEEHLVAMTPRSAAPSAKHSPRPGGPTVTTLTKEIVAKIFYSDSELLEVGLQVTLKLAQTSFNLSQNYFATSRLYEEALQIILLTWKDNIFLDPRAGRSHKPLVSPRGGPPSTGGRTSPVRSVAPKRRTSQINSMGPQATPRGLDDFGLIDPAICFPILTGIATLYRSLRLKDDDKHTKEATMYNLFLTLAQSSPAYRMHLLVGYCYKRSIDYDLNRRQEAIHLTDIVRHMYDSELYSAEAVRIYGNDRMPYTMAINIQLLVMMGQPFRAKNYMFHVKELYPNINHLHSQGITIIAIAPVLVQFGMPGKAQELFKMYNDGVEMRGAFSFFRDVIPLFSVWLRLETKVLEYKTTKDVNVLLGDDQCSTELSVMTTRFLGMKLEQRPVVHGALDAMGTSLEYVCSRICALRAFMWTTTKQRSETEIIANLDFALKYIDYNIKCCEGQDKLAFGYYTSLLAKAHILMTISWRVAMTDQAAEEEARRMRLEAKATLMRCHDFGKQNNYPFVCLSVGVLLDRIGLDAVLADEILLENVRLGTANVNGAEESAAVAAAMNVGHEEFFKIGKITPEDNFECMAHLFPVVERFRDLVLTGGGDLIKE